ARGKRKASSPWSWVCSGGNALLVVGPSAKDSPPCGWALLSFALAWRPHESHSIPLHAYPGGPTRSHISGSRENGGGARGLSRGYVVAGAGGTFPGHPPGAALSPRAPALLRRQGLCQLRGRGVPGPPE